jgi:hypothetical protein
MSEPPTPLRRKGPLARVGELLSDGHANCSEELGAFVIVYSRINKLFAGLKRGNADVKPGTSAERLGEEYRALCETLGVAFDRASAAFLSAEWPKSRTDIWQENQERLVQAVTAFTQALTRLLDEYGP